jgi:Protein of unknown function (DUF3147)
MRISIDISSVRQTTVFEYAIRFFLGGIITAVAGVIANEFGPSAGGLFLAFPAIFPATATLVEKHENEKKRAAGLRESVRGRKAAALDATGAAIGSVGLFAFALLVEHLAGKHNPWTVLLSATLLWFVVAALLWRCDKSGTLKLLKVSLRRRIRPVRSSIN